MKTKFKEFKSLKTVLCALLLATAIFSGITAVTANKPTTASAATSDYINVSIDYENGTPYLNINAFGTFGTKEFHGVTLYKDNVLCGSYLKVDYLTVNYVPFASIGGGWYNKKITLLPLLNISENNFINNVIDSLPEYTFYARIEYRGGGTEYIDSETVVFRHTDNPF
jgi:hypothetical protein